MIAKHTQFTTPDQTATSQDKGRKGAKRCRQARSVEMIAERYLFSYHVLIISLKALIST